MMIQVFSPAEDRASVWVNADSRKRRPKTFAPQRGYAREQHTQHLASSFRELARARGNEDLKMRSWVMKRISLAAPLGLTP